MANEVFTQTAPLPPARLKIVSVENPSLVLEAQFNPQQLSIALRPQWAEHKVPGLSHPIQHYNYTDARQVTFDIEFDADALEGSLQRVTFAKNFLEAMCYTSRAAQNIKQGQPNRLMFNWPRVMSWTTRIGDIDMTLNRFNRQGSLVAFTAKVTLVEIRDVRLYSEDIMDGSNVSTGVAPAPSGNFS